MDTAYARKLLAIVATAMVVSLSGLATSRAGQQSASDPYAQEIDAIRLLHHKANYPEAIDRSRSLLGKVEKDPTASAVTIASVMDVLIESLSNAEQTASLKEAVPLARRAVELKEQSVGSEDRRTAYSRLVLGGVLSKTGQPAEARKALESALAVFLRTVGPDHELTGRALTTLAVVARQLGDRKASKDFAQRGVTTLERAFGPEDISVARALLNLSSALDDLGEMKPAIQGAQRAIEILRNVYKGDHPVLAHALSNYAWIMDRANEFTESHAAHMESAAMYERTLGADSTALARELNNYGLLYWRLGDFESARPLFERALAIWTAAKSQDASRALNNLAITARRVGDLTAARNYYEQSLAIKEKALDPEHPEVALVLFNMANLLKEMGDYGAALPRYERALRIREKRLGPTDTLTASALNGLGQVFVALDAPAKAKPLVERAVRIWHQLNAPDVAIGLSTLAEIANDAGDLASASAHYDETLAVYEKVFGPNNIDVAITLNNSAVVVRRRGNYEEARRRYTRALDIFERQFDADHPSIAEIATGLAYTNWELGDTRQALALALRGERISREHFRLTSRTLSEREAVTFGENRAPALDVLMTLAVSGELGPDDTRNIMDAAIRSRALVLDEITQRTGLGKGGEDKNLVDAVSRSRQQLANLIVRGARPGETGYAALVDAARTEREAAERRLASASLAQRNRLTLENAGLTEVAGALTSDASLVTFMMYSHLTRGAPSLKDDRRYAALVARGNSKEIVVVPLGAVADVDAQVSRWRRAIMAAPGVRSERSYATVAGALADRVWRPIAPHVQDARRLFIVPDGALNLVSFAALPDAPNRYLVEGPLLVHYLSAERDLVSSPTETRPSSGLLAVGNPSYTRASSRAAPPASAVTSSTRGGLAGCPEFQHVRFERLAGTAREIEDIAGLWKSQGGAVAEKLMGDGATESAFKQTAPNHRILHLATHGFFLGSCEPAAVPTRGVGGLANNAIRKHTAPQPVIPLSGLALAGANQRARAASDQDDGILTAEEVAGLDLRGVEWAVLSACDTGIGEVRAGEGVFGLRRGFGAAGVRTTIMSLWSVEDQSTREWMTALYRARLIDARSTVEAVAQASRELLRSRRERRLSTHPFYWAAFVAAGDWR